MEFKTTCTTEKRRSRSGVALMELLIGVSAGSIALAAIGALSVYTTRSFAAMTNYMELDKNSRNALDRMTQLIREADGVTSYDPHSVSLSLGAKTLAFNYSPQTKKLTMIDTNGVATTLLEDCDYLNFQTFQRNGIPGTYDQYPATLDESSAKLVQVSWICSRRLIGDLLNTESVQSAKIVIRKQ